MAISCRGRGYGSHPFLRAGETKEIAERVQQR
jgi:hypothetical protein